MSDTNKALIEAAINGDAQAIPQLLAAGANPNVIGYAWSPVLELAAGNGHTAAVEALLAGGAALGGTSRYGSTALRTASARGHTQAALVLLDAWTRAHPGHERECALLRATLAGDASAVSAALAIGADVNAVLDAAPTPLLHAVCVGDTEVMERLLAAGAVADGSTEAAHDMNTPLMAAILARHAHAVRLLLAALMTAALWGNVDTVRVLLDAGANINAASASGRTALMCAAKAGNADAVRLLIERGADVHATDEDGDTALRQARNADVVVLLLKAPLPGVGGGT